MSQELATKRRLHEIIAEYETKLSQIPEVLLQYEQACTDIKTAATISGTWGNVNIDTGKIYESKMQESLLRSAWYHVYNDMGLKTVMSAKDKNRFEQFMTSPLVFTVENIREIFGDFVLDPRGNILRGLAEVFCDLDQSYKSHEKVKIGVKGLPKRIIMSGFNSYSFWGWERLADVINALATYRNQPQITYFTLRDLVKNNPETLEKEYGVVLKLFNNGNGHLHFDADALRDINLALAEYYGDILADCAEEKPTERSASTEISKDLQYYPTPTKVVDKLMDKLYFSKGGELILEPSCGCGRIMDGIARYYREKGVVCHGVEVDPARAEEARSKGHKVLTANFLEIVPTPKYDWVVMNPPFYGKHYAKHIEHALKFLKEGGILIAVLPITARYDHGLVNGQWDDLPVGSFASSGTNVNTTILTIRK